MKWKPNMTQEEALRWRLEEYDEADELGSRLVQWEEIHEEEVEKLSRMEKLRIGTVVYRIGLEIPEEELYQLTAEQMLELRENLPSAEELYLMTSEQLLDRIKNLPSVKNCTEKMQK